jgi:hypothetical protein
MIKPSSGQIQEHIQKPFWQANLNQENCSKALPSPPKICSPPSTENCSYEYKRPSAKIQAKRFKSRFPLPQWDTYFSNLGGPWRKVLQRWSEDFQTTGSREKKSMEHTQGEEGETIPYRTCEVADRNRGGSNGSDTQPVSEIEIRDGGSCRWGSFDHWKPGLVQKDPHCFSLLKNTVRRRPPKASRDAHLVQLLTEYTVCPSFRYPLAYSIQNVAATSEKMTVPLVRSVPHLPIRLRMGHWFGEDDNSGVDQD